jgi:Xaa-Pro aminopeptidase
MPNEKVWILDQKYAGESCRDKYINVAAKMPKDYNSLMITTLDDIAWLLNLRGNDI